MESIFYGDANNIYQFRFLLSLCRKITTLNRLLYRINYFSAPLVKFQSDDHLELESIRNKVWNPVFTVGVIGFVLSMTLRGFFDQRYAVFPLAVSTIILISGVWILSATATIIFDKVESKSYFVYKHLGYLQKIYEHPLSSFDEVALNRLNGKSSIQLLKDDGTLISVASRRDENQLEETASVLAGFLNIPLRKP